MKGDQDGKDNMMLSGMKQNPDDVDREMKRRKLDAEDDN